MLRILILISALSFLGACSTLHVPNNANHKHTQTVHFVINNLDDGEVMTWNDNPTNTSGSVMVMMTQAYGGKFCRLVNSQVTTAHRTKNFSEYACSNDNGRTWQFYPH